MSNEVSKRLPPRIILSPEEMAAKRQALEQRDAQIRGVSSIHEMREAIKQASRALSAITEVPRVKLRDAASFRARAMQGLPFLVDGVVGRWPLTQHTPDILRERYAQLHVRARVIRTQAHQLAQDFLGFREATAVHVNVGHPDIRVG